MVTALFAADQSRPCVTLVLHYLCYFALNRRLNAARRRAFKTMDDMKRIVIVKFHEPALKGKNRPMFIRRLASNLRRAVKGAGVERVWQAHMMICLALRDETDWPLVRERVANCFGVAKFFLAHKIAADLDAVKDLLPSELEKRDFRNFRITAHRTDKRFPIKSDIINRELGAYVQEIAAAPVRLKDPDLEIFIDVLHDGILVYFDPLQGYGGMPVDVSGTTLALMSGGIDSPVAAWQMMKRGSRVKFLHFHSHPLVDTSSIEKASELSEIMTRYQYDAQLFLAPFGDVQRRIIVDAPPPYRVVLYRRFMVRIAEALARREGIAALVTGESLAQVASQTLENIAVVDEVARMPILRPLIGFNKNEIIDLARRIDTYPVSILPDQDCCTLFVPRHPVIKSSAEVVRRLESALPVAELVEETLDRVETRSFGYAPRT